MIRAPVGRAPWAGPRAVSPGQRAGERAMGAHSGALYGRLHGPACGLVLFMFLIGLELDLPKLRDQSHKAVLIRHASIVRPIYDEHRALVDRPADSDRRPGRGDDAPKRCASASCCPTVREPSSSGETSRWSGIESVPPSRALQAVDEDVADELPVDVSSHQIDARDLESMRGTIPEGRRPSRLGVPQLRVGRMDPPPTVQGQCRTSEMALTRTSFSALGGTRTPNLLIRIRFLGWLG